VRNWADIKARVGHYRRCFVYAHRSMPSEPVVVLHVALTRGVPASIGDVVRHHPALRRMATLDARTGEDADSMDSAIFYSITSTQKGLQGIELGTYLIKQAVKRLKEELPHLEHFSSLSPIPGFRAWLLAALQTAKREDQQAQTLFTAEERSALVPNGQEPASHLLNMFKSNTWADDEATLEVCRAPLTRLCARYLYAEKHRGQALDPVANFHLRNGAVLWRVNWRADASKRGMDNSCGLMVNYKYFLDQLEANSTEYQESGGIKTDERVAAMAEAARTLVAH